MKLLQRIFLFVFLSTLGVSQASAGDTFYLVRHAEKQSDGTNDPSLTKQGRKRAHYLAQQLSLANITKIYSTNYKRTLETAKPLSELLGIPVALYNPGSLNEFAETLNTEPGNIVVFGHSNTTPTLAKLLSGEAVGVIDESDYENLYQIVVLGGKAKLTRFKIFPIDSTPIAEQKAVESAKLQPSDAAIRAKKRARKRVRKK